jgi:hypothetical protein
MLVLPQGISRVVDVPPLGREEAAAMASDLMGTAGDALTSAAIAAMAMGLPGLVLTYSRLPASQLASLTQVGGGTRIEFPPLGS